MEEARRRNPRLPESCTVLASATGRIKNEGFHRTHDLGLDGCSFESRHPYGIGTKLKLALSIERRVLALEGRVVREKGESSEGYVVGVEFTGGSKESREMLASLFELERFSLGQMEENHRRRNAAG